VEERRAFFSLRDGVVAFVVGVIAVVPNLWLHIFVILHCEWLYWVEEDGILLFVHYRLKLYLDQLLQGFRMIKVPCGLIPQQRHFIHTRSLLWQLIPLLQLNPRWRNLLFICFWALAYIIVYREDLQIPLFHHTVLWLQVSQEVVNSNLFSLVAHRHIVNRMVSLLESFRDSLHGINKSSTILWGMMQLRK